MCVPCLLDVGAPVPVKRDQGSGVYHTVINTILGFLVSIMILTVLIFVFVGIVTIVIIRSLQSSIGLTCLRNH